jgi:hypothetical protein
MNKKPAYSLVYSTEPTPEPEAGTQPAPAFPSAREQTARIAKDRNRD